MIKLTLALPLALLASCDQPKVDQDPALVCVESHMERRVVHSMAAPFQPVKVGPVRVINRRVCDRWEARKP